MDFVHVRLLRCVAALMTLGLLTSCGRGGNAGKSPRMTPSQTAPSQSASIASESDREAKPFERLRSCCLGPIGSSPLAAGFGTADGSVTSGSTSAMVARPAADTGLYGKFAGMTLLDQDGQRFDPSTLRGRIVLVNFIFTGCSSVCPIQTHALAEMLRQLPLRSRLSLLSVSLDPLNDTPKALKTFAQRMGADLSRWSFVAGRPEDLARLSASLRLWHPGAQERRPDDHVADLWLVDPEGQLRQRYVGNPVDVARVLREIAGLDALLRRSPT